MWPSRLSYKASRLTASGPCGNQKQASRGQPCAHFREGTSGVQALGKGQAWNQAGSPAEFGQAARILTAEAASSSGYSNPTNLKSFVRLFRDASPYIAGHRDCTFVIVLPGEVLQNADILVKVVDDIATVHALGVKMVVVLGAAPLINKAVRLRGSKPSFFGGYRLTDETAMEAAMEAAGTSRTLIEALLSKGPAVPMVRRHARTSTEFHYKAAMRVVSGNYIAAKRRGVIDGIDYGYTGQVRFVDKDAIQHQLNSNNLVLLSNLGYSTAGELLNCNTFDVATHAAIELKADKLICMHMEEVSSLRLPPWLSLSTAEEMFKRKGHKKGDYLDSLTDSSEEGGDDVTESEESEPEADEHPAYSIPPFGIWIDGKPPSDAETVQTVRTMNGSEEVAAGSMAQKLEQKTRMSSFPPAVMACYEACRGGVKRAHLVDARLDGGIILELYSRDGVGTMISTDFYEGIRRAGPFDISYIKELLEPLEAAGIVVPRSRAKLTDEIDTFVVAEREQRILACVQLKQLGASEDGQYEKVGEVAAFCVHPDFRGTGRGDSLLDWVEQDARFRGFDCLVLLTTRTADWFQARDFRLLGPAHSSKVLPADRRARVDPKRNSQLYIKKLEPCDDGMLPAGTRIGF